VAFPARVGEEIIVTLHTGTPTYPMHMDIGAPPSGFVAARDLTASPAAEGLTTISTRPHLALVAVRNPRVACTIVAFGDSITDGALARSTVTRGWPGRLAERLAVAPAAQRCGVVNSGIGSAQLLADSYGGKAALIRAGRDILAVPGVTHVILLEGINDIGGSGSDGQPILTSDVLIAGYRQMIAQAHQAGLKIIGGTITPFIGAGYYTPLKEAMRQRVNAFIRTGGEFDGFVDFDAAVRDPARPVHLNPAFDPGDHLHPNDAGYRAMGDAIDLALFAPKR
jgi:lysophospholipase L1-like esterase